MADLLQKVIPGQAFRPSAGAWNAFVDAARYAQANSRGRGTPLLPAFDINTGIVVVKNDTDENIDRFGVLGVDSALIIPSDNPDLFKTRVLLNGKKPTTEAHAGKFVVLLEPIAGGQIGHACINGACQALIDVIQEADEFADVKDNDAASLESGSSGARILYKEPGTGIKLAYIHIGAGGGAEFPVGQYPGMGWFTVANNQNAMAFPFAV